MEAFGDNALCVPKDALAGHASPFDTGGLVAHISPVNGWENRAKRNFLNKYSWPTGDLNARLLQYPTAAPELVLNYLDGGRPSPSGPDAVWGSEDSSPAAAIWHEETNSLQAWLWEGRVPGQWRSAPRLAHWSCAPARYAEILKFGETLSSEADVGKLAQLMDRYVHGGVSAMVNRLLRLQKEAA